MSQELPSSSPPFPAARFDQILQHERVARVRSALYQLERTGWVLRGVMHPETVGQHIDALVALVDDLPEEALVGINRDKLKRMLFIHDWPESKEKVGDRVTAGLKGEERRKAIEEKKRLELEAMQEICADLGSEGSLVLDLWCEFEDSVSPEAILGHQLDKLQAVLKAAEYQAAGQPVQVQEFIDHVHLNNEIRHSVLLKILDDIEARFK